MARARMPFVFRLTPIVTELLKLDRHAASELVRGCGLPLESLDGVCTAPLAAVTAFMDEAALRSKSSAFGLDVADAVPEGTYETAELLARFSALFNPVGRFEVRDLGRRCELHYDVPGEPRCLGPTMNEFTIAYIARACDWSRTGPFRSPASGSRTIARRCRGSSRSDLAAPCSTARPPARWRSAPTSPIARSARAIA